MKDRYLLKDLLLDMFGDLKETYPDFNIIGNEAVFSFDADRFGKLGFTIYARNGSANSNVFNGCEINIMSRTRGQIEKKYIAFADVFDSILDLNHPNKIGKHIWMNDGYDWYGKPTNKDKADMFNVVKSYLDMFRVKEAPAKTSLEDMMAAALNKAMNQNKEPLENDSLKKAYEQAVSFINEVQVLAKKSELSSELYNLHKDDVGRKDAEEANKALIEKIKSFDTKNLLKDISNKTELERK